MEISPKDLLDLSPPTLRFARRVHAAALYYIRNGLPVIPIKSGDKGLPEGTGLNYQSASLKKDTIDRWFGVEGKYAGFNIGIACGTNTGVMALDIDSKPVRGTTGLIELKKITDKEGPLPAGPVQKTPSGGFHHLFKWQENAVSSSSKVANGIDTRGGMADRYTGHIVVYPSVVDGHTYEWVEGGVVPEAPKWLMDKLGKPWSPSDVKPTKTEVSEGQVSRMLAAIDPNDLSYEEWVKVGMALKSCQGENGFALWDEWSIRGERRKDGECGFRWKSFNDDGPVGFGTLLFMAKNAGWRPMPGDVTSSGNESEVEERVLEMNTRYALVRASKSLMMATFSNNADNKSVDFLSMQSFKDLTAPEKILVNTSRGVAQKPMADIWLASPLRRAYSGMGIYPRNDGPSNMLNIWDGWGVEPSETASCDLYLFHLRTVICSGDETIYGWLLDWMADCVQDSRLVKGCCVVLRGIEGCGKGVFADNFGKLFGAHYSHIIDSERLTGKFNSYLADSIVIYADEVLWPGDRKAANVLKGRITETRIHREAKGIDAVEVDNLARVIIASNEDWIIPAGPQSRRWCVLNVSGSKVGNREYFDRLSDEMNNGGRAALLHLLLNRKITRDLRIAPVTDALLEQRAMSAGHDSVMHWLNEALAKGTFDTIDIEASVGDDIRWPRKVRKYELYAEYRGWAKDTGVSRYDVLQLAVFSSRIERYGFSVSSDIAEVPSKDDLMNRLHKALGQG